MKPKYFSKTVVKIVFCSIILMLLSTFTQAQDILFTEIMFAPSQSNSEFIELFNNSNKIIDLKGFKIKYYTTSPDEIISLKDDYQLSPNQYAVIFEADYDFISGVYTSLVPDSVLIFVLDDNAFGSGGMANSSDRKLFLISALNDTIVTQTYSADNSNGYSDELVSADDSIWANSIILNGTPGFKNSVTPVQYDLEIKKFYPDSLFSTINNEVVLYVEIKNRGKSVAENFELLLYADNDNNSVGDSSELVYNKIFENLEAQDSMRVNIDYQNIIIGDNDFIVELHFIYDENNSNNFEQLTVMGVSPNELKGIIIVNEIMYSPKSPEPEWIELYNNGVENVKISGFKIADNNDTIDITIDELIINPSQYLVIADDSSLISTYPNISDLLVTNLPTLNNSGDKVIILDSLNRMIDSLEYFSDWGGNNGSSLERIEPFYISWEKESWVESSFPTPGIINSVTQKDFDLKIDTVFTNPSAPIIGKNYTISAQISNIGKNEMQFKLQLALDSNQDSLADKFIEETEEFSLSPQKSISVDFLYNDLMDNVGRNFIIELITKDDDTTNNNYFSIVIPSYPSKSILINEFLYSSGNFEPEWIELYNDSKYDINLEKWSIGDVLTNPVFKSIENPFVILAGEYLVISKRNSIYDFHRSISSQVIEMSFANLNNDEDGIVLKDRNNITIDSLKYSNSWSEKAGNSLERVSVSNSSLNMNNWKSSLDIEGSTPGRINSRTRKDYDLVIKVIEPNPKYPIEGDNIKFSITIHNRGDKNAEDFDVEISALNNNDVILIESFNHLFIETGDSLNLITNNNISIEDTLLVFGEIFFSIDQDIINNYYEKKIIPGFNRNTVLINEVMFKPNPGDPKWIELINNSDTTVNIKNWLIGDLTTKNILTEIDTWVEPSDYLVICDNLIPDLFSSETNVIKSNFPNLSATKDAIIIYDYRNAVIDSMFYQVESNFNRSVSLERVSLSVASELIENWTFSISDNKSTPGLENSITSLPNNNFADIIFTEIMFDPLEENSEFIELCNISDYPIEIGGWSISDLNGRLFTINGKSHVLDPNNYYVVSADSLILDNYSWLFENDNLSIINKSSLSLNNSRKLLILKDVNNSIIDSVEYQASWHNTAQVETKNISLELINFHLQRNMGSNWSSCVNGFGASPGQDNSIDVKNVVSKAKLKITPNPFSPDNDGFEDFTFINFNLSKPISQVRIRVFDSKGRKVRSIINNQLVGPEGTILFDGLDDNKRQLKMGIYIILFEAVNNENVVVDVIKEVVVVARKL